MGDLAKNLLSKYVAPFKIYFYIAAAAALIGWWEIHNYHERKIGAQQYADKVTELAKLRQKFIDDLDTEANKKAAKLESEYEKARTTPSTNHRTARVCRDQGNGSNVVSAPVAGTGGDNGHADSGEGHNLVAGPDIGDTLINIGKHADDQVKALQQRIRDLEQEMNDAH